tara:strand:- start:48 stop:533 length:486 start_codon:yes stop_codon:yes gene_type:complete
MPAVSKAQQRFFGMVRATQKGEMKNPSSEILDVADDISVKDAKKMAKTKHKGLPEKKDVKEEDNYSTRDSELKRTKKPRDQRYKTLHKKTDDSGNVDVNEEASYKDFVKSAQEASARVKKAKEDKASANAKSAYRDRVTKGVRFYDKKGSGHIKDGKKVYV